jgi:uncharacterized protein YbjT (DUF2867 family)
MTVTPPILTILRATGNQGGAVTSSLHKNPAFNVRALTRSPISNASRSLAALGLEARQANGFNYESMEAAFRGSWGAFVNINSDDKVRAILISAQSMK